MDNPKKFKFLIKKNLSTVHILLCYENGMNIVSCTGDHPPEEDVVPLPLEPGYSIETKQDIFEYYLEFRGKPMNYTGRKYLRYHFCNRCLDRLQKEEFSKEVW